MGDTVYYPNRNYIEISRYSPGWGSGSERLMMSVAGFHEMVIVRGVGGHISVHHGVAKSSTC